MSFVPLNSLLVLLLIAAGSGTSLKAADEIVRLTDVEAAFDRVSADGALHTFPRAELGVPPGGHIQGIQLKHDAAGNRCLALSLLQDGMWLLSTERSLGDNVRINIAR